MRENIGLMCGKRKDNGEWVIGYYGQFHNRPDVMEENSHQIFVPMENATAFGSVIGGLWYEVIPETVGEFSSLNDAEGKTIFEGDILEYINSDGEKDYFSVGFRDGCFCVVEEGYEGKPVDPLADALGLKPKIVGNIYDNPEILKE